jgi:TonB family protein
MPDWMRVLGAAGLLCLLHTNGVCQDGQPQSSLAHYRRAESYFLRNDLQSAANEYREALNGDMDAPWTAVWSHIRLGRIFDATGQHNRAVNEYREAQRTGDNTNHALDEAKKFLSTTAVDPIQKTDPEYTDQARLAELEGTVVLRGTIDEEGLARNLEVAQSIGLGLDEKAIEAAGRWSFQPVSEPVIFLIPVSFRLPSKQSRWHLINAQFQTPAGASSPVFTRALYPVGAGIGPEAMEEGRVLVAIGRLATAKLAFHVDEHGMPVNFEVLSSSEPVWGSEAIAVVGQWRFTPGMKTGIAIPVPGTVELVWGERELTSSLERQLHDVLAAR